MIKFKQYILTFIIKAIQKLGPHKVRVSGKSYIISEGVFNPKFYITSTFMAQNIHTTPKDEVLDMGTGSGIQAIAAGQVARRVVATDINPEAVRCARENIRRNGLTHRISVLHGDLFSSIPAGSLFDIILFTPPYMEGRLKKDFDHALYDPGKSTVSRFFSEAKYYLKPDGYVQMVYSSVAEPEYVLAKANELGWRYGVIARKRVLFETFFIYKLDLKID